MLQIRVDWILIRKNIFFTYSTVDPNPTYTRTRTLSNSREKTLKFYYKKNYKKTYTRPSYNFLSLKMFIFCDNVIVPIGPPLLFSSSNQKNPPPPPLCAEWVPITHNGLWAEGRNSKPVVAGGGGLGLLLTTGCNPQKK